jgi:hypothetical protein
LCCCLSGTAHAAITFSVESGQDGFFMRYTIPFIGIGRVTLDNPGDSDTIPVSFGLIKLADVELELNSIQTNACSLHYVIVSSYIPEPAPEGDISVPFGSFGAVANLMGKRFMRTGDNDIDISLLLTNNQTRYEVIADIPGLVDDSWSGTADSSNSIIEEQVTNPESGATIADVALTLDYSLPFFTNVTYDITFYLSAPGSQDDTDNATDTQIPPIQGGPVPVPNGSYHFWADIDETAVPEFPNAE